MRTLERTPALQGRGFALGGVSPFFLASLRAEMGEPPPRLALPLPRPRALSGSRRGPKQRRPPTRKGHLMITNLDRANWADKAIRTFRKQTGCDIEDSLCDLIADLRHWADAQNCDFDAALYRAGNHYEAELGDEGKPVRNSDIVTNLIAVLQQALTALNTAPRFKVPSLETDSYRIAALCDEVIAKTKREGA